MHSTLSTKIWHASKDHRTTKSGTTLGTVTINVTRNSSATTEMSNGRSKPSVFSISQHQNCRSLRCSPSKISKSISLLLNDSDSFYQVCIVLLASVIVPEYAIHLPLESCMFYASKVHCTTKKGHSTW